MPIDPQTGLDPDTGMMGLKETHQPTGAIGAVMSYLNADKSRQISEALQQHRAASAQMEQQQADEYQAKQMRDDQIRQALAKLGPAAGQQDVIGTYLRSGGDVERVLPWMRAQTSAGAKVDAARVKAGAEFAMTRIKLGDSPANVITSMAGTYSPDEMEEIKKTLSSQPLPVPGAIAGEKEAKGNLETTQAGDITATQPSRIALNKAKAESARLLAQSAAERAKRGGTRQRSTTLAIEGQIARLGKYINDTMEKVDPLTLRRGPKDMTQVNEWKAQKARLEAELAAADEGDDDDDDVDESAKAALAKPGAPKGSPDPFGSIGFLKKTTTPAGGSTTAPGGTSSYDPFGLLPKKP